MHKGEHSKAERGEGGMSLPAPQETAVQHTGRKDEALTPLCGEECGLGLEHSLLLSKLCCGLQ